MCRRSLSPIVLRPSPLSGIKRRGIYVTFFAVVYTIRLLCMSSLGSLILFSSILWGVINNYILLRVYHIITDVR